MKKKKSGMAILLADYHSISLEQLITQLYGPEAKLGEPDCLFREAVKGEVPRAVSWSAYHWVFDQAKLLEWYDACPLTTGKVSLYFLNPDQYCYGYASYVDGALVAKQFGTDQDISYFHDMSVLAALEHVTSMSPFGEHRDAFKDLMTQPVQ